MRYSKLGGQAVIEGVMMKHEKEYSVAVRKPDGGIEVTKKATSSIRDKYKIASLPIIRGMVIFAESLLTGMKTLNYSASFFGWIRGIEQQVSEEEEKEAKEKNEKKESLVMGLVMLLAIVLAVGIFVIVPFLISEALKRPVPSPQLRGLIEGVIRVALFVAYVKLISCMEDIKRVFMYHGAEHKSINCVENGKELTVENVRMQTTVHKRCGTSFLLIVMFVSILFFMFIVVGNVWLRMVLRILLIPVIAGLSYEFIRYAGEHDNKVINVLSKPGLMLQSLTTKEPDDSMIEVAIAAVEAVFDWKAFLEEEKTENEEEPVEEVEEKVEDEIEILSIDDEDDGEEDEILNALDRYFEAPEPSDEEKKESDT